MARDQLPPDSTLRVPAATEMSGSTQRVPREGPGPAATLPPESEATLLVARDAMGGPLPSVAPCGTLANQRRLPLGILQAGETLLGNCVVRETVRPQETLRPGLYDCDAPEGRVMVKVAATEHPPMLDLWSRLPALVHPSLVRTHRVDYINGFCAEVQEFCEGGTLDACVPREGRSPLSWETIEKSIIPSFQAGITYLHTSGIVHRDVKPKNLYLRRAGKGVTVVIGDFDISSVIESDHTSRDTSRGAGTHFYMAPEAFPRFVDPGAGRAAAIVSPASDYYSFGVVLVELLLGTTSLHSGRWSDIYDFYMSGARLEIPGGVPDRARELMQGLLIRNRRTRWGAPEVQRWLNGASTEDDLRRIRDDNGFELINRASRPYNVFPSRPTDVPSLAKAMAENPVVAEEELMAGDVLVNWLGELDVNLAREVRRDREKWRHAPRMALMCALMRLDPTLPFTLAPGKTVHSLEEFRDKVTRWVADKELDLAVVTGRGTLTRLEAWLRLKANAEPMQAEAVEDLRQAWWGDRATAVLTPLNVRNVWEELQWMIDPLRPFYISRGVAVRTPAELARFCYGTQEDWANGVPSVYRAALDRWKEGALNSWLRQRARDAEGNVSPVVAQIDDLREKTEFAPEATWEAVLRLLDPTLPRVTVRLEAPGGNRSLMAEWGTISSLDLNYEVTSPGLPFGVWTVEDGPPAMVVEPLMVSQRQGQLRVRLNTANGLEPGSAGRCLLKLDDAGNCSLENPLPIFYRVRLPDSQRNDLVRNGVLLGAGLAGGARLIAFLCTGPEWKPPVPAPSLQTSQNGQAETGEGTDGSTAGTEAVAPVPAEAVRPPAGYLGAATALVLAIVIAVYAWMEVVRKYAHK